MDTSRFILLLALGLVGMMLMQKWEEDYGTQVVAEEAGVAEILADSQTSNDLPDLPLFNESGDPSEGLDIPDAPADLVVSAAKVVSVQTDVFGLEISLRGAGIDYATLSQYPVARDEPNKPLVYFDKTSELFYIMQGGLRSQSNLPTHKSLFSSNQTTYSLADGEDSLEVPFYWQSDDGVLVEKIYRFHRDSYVIEIEYRIQNNSISPLKAAAYNQLQRDDPGRKGRRLLYTFTGAVVSTPEERYEKLSFGDMEDKALKAKVANGWVAMIQHYFVSALLPGPENQAYQYYSIALPEQNRYFIGAMTPAVEITPGNDAVLSQQAYVGPKTQKRLENLAPNLELVVDYGMLWFIAKPLFICLEWFHGLTGNWGWAIIMVTILLKLFFYPLSAAGYRSMARMRQVQPRLLSVRDRYKNDKQRLNQAMMELYKEEKINPLGGCFPILIQIPVFIALYWVLLETVEMRQAPFMLWLQDLSSPDPWYVLPVLMGISMFIQQKLNPAPMDPVQQKVMSFLPIAFTIFFAFFPSGLVLYWVSNNVLSIAQQAKINNSLEKAGLK